METIIKPEVSFYKEPANVFHLLGICVNALKAAGKKHEVKTLIFRVWNEDSYSASILIMKEYCDINWTQ